MTRTASAQPTDRSRLRRTHERGAYDSAALYAVLGGLLRLATGRTGAAVAWAGAYGVSDEVHQAFVPGRSPDPLDWLADAFGAWVGAALVARAVRRARRRTVE